LELCQLLVNDIIS